MAIKTKYNRLVIYRCIAMRLFGYKLPHLYEYPTWQQFRMEQWTRDNEGRVIYH